MIDANAKVPKPGDFVAYNCMGQIHTGYVTKVTKRGVVIIERVKPDRPWTGPTSRVQGHMGVLVLQEADS